MRPGDLDRPWLVAAWPGMGAVALGAATWLRAALGAEEVEVLPGEGYFDVTQVGVKDGLVGPAALPRSTLHAWKNPAPGGQDLLVFVGEAQPALRGYRFCRELVARAIVWRAARVFTFAAMATPIHPKAPARVFAAVNRPSLREALKAQVVEPLREGEISGLNGVLVAAAAERDLEGLCLLGEFPYFASQIPNPKASAAVLRVFSSMAGLDLDLSPLEAEARELEARLTELLERLQRASPASLAPFVGPSEGEGSPGETDEEPGAGSQEEGGLSPADREHVERLFAEARRDRGKALALKAELDRLGVFRAYEDRFLDLFRRGE